MDVPDPIRRSDAYELLASVFEEHRKMGAELLLQRHGTTQTSMLPLGCFDFEVKSTVWFSNNTMGVETNEVEVLVVIIQLNGDPCERLEESIFLVSPRVQRKTHEEPKLSWINRLAEQAAGDDELAQLVAAAVDRGCDPNAMGENYSSVLSDMIALGFRRTAQSLIDLGASYFLESGRFESSLHCAARRNDGVLIGALINAGWLTIVDQVSCTMESALNLAGRLGKVHAVRALISGGASVDGGDGDDVALSALVSAISAGQVACVEILLSGGADPLDVKHGPLTPVHRAAKHPSLRAPEMLDLLRSATQLNDKEWAAYLG